MAIGSFSGEYRWLSNFYPSEITYEGIVYPTVEHAYQAAKTTVINLRQQVANRKSPWLAKRLGRQLYLRENWDGIRIGVMHDLLRLKFRPGSVLAEKLEATGDAELIEGNTWGDTYWGVSRGKGTNHLGRLLMTVRKENRNDRSGNSANQEESG